MIDMGAVKFYTVGTSDGRLRALFFKGLTSTTLYFDRCAKILARMIQTTPARRQKWKGPSGLSVQDFLIQGRPSMTKNIELTRGKFAMVDDEDYAELSKYNWCAVLYHGIYYAMRKITVNGKRKSVHMHREITNAPDNMLVDHKNGDGIDNRRCNLRLASKSQNQHNAKRRKDNTSGYRGVARESGGDTWRAAIHINGKGIRIGTFGTAEEAARAYDEAARKYHGEFARTNF